jgi:hypothetical protein
MKTMQIKAVACDSACDAIQWADASGQGEAVLMEGGHFVVPQSECNRMAVAGVEFAYVHYSEAHDRIMTVPIN